jgi:hypothetical protein
MPDLAQPVRYNLWTVQKSKVKGTTAQRYARWRFVQEMPEMLLSFVTLVLIVQVSGRNIRHGGTKYTHQENTRSEYEYSLRRQLLKENELNFMHKDTNQTEVRTSSLSLFLFFNFHFIS